MRTDTWTAIKRAGQIPGNGQPWQVAPIGNRLYRRLATGLATEVASQRAIAHQPAWKKFASPPAPKKRQNLD